MYLVNNLSLQASLTIFVAASRFRNAQVLAGMRDGVNTMFRVPGAEHYLHNLPFFSVAVYLNGMRLALLDDYVVVESLGPGTGYDAVLLNEAPFSDDHLFADYVTA